MITIHKYMVSIHDFGRAQKTSRIIEIINVAKYEDHPELIWVWAMVDDKAEQETTFNIIGTGHQVPSKNKFCGTVITDVGLVWHLFVPESNFPNPSFGRKVVE